MEDRHRSREEQYFCTRGVLLYFIQSSFRLEDTYIYIPFSLQFKWELVKKAHQVFILHFALKKRVFIEEIHEKQEQVSNVIFTNFLFDCIYLNGFLYIFCVFDDIMHI